MSFTLYHYVHCPFCVRVRMALNYLNISYQSQVLNYDDEETPIKLTGKKMLPALSYNGTTMNESLDIIAFLDKQNILKVKEITSSADFAVFESYLNRLGDVVHSLAMPYWIFTPEFTPAAREYFQKKKEVKRGPFKELVKNQETFINKLQPLFKEMEEKLNPFYEGSAISLKDIMLASHLWGLYVVPEFQFPEKIHSYLKEVKKITHFNYHQDFWS
jgi:glutaredoxin 2